MADICNVPIPLEFLSSESASLGFGIWVCYTASTPEDCSVEGQHTDSLKKLENISVDREGGRGDSGLHDPD